MSRHRANHNMVWSDAEVLQALDLEDQGVSKSQIGREIGRSTSSVASVCSAIKRGIKQRPSSASSVRPSRPNNRRPYNRANNFNPGDNRVSSEYMLAEPIKQFNTVDEMNRYIEQNGLQGNVAVRKLRTTLRVIE